MGDRLEAALIDLLARIDAGERVSDDQLRAAYPDCWEPLREVLELRSRFAALDRPAATEDAPHTKLRPVNEGRYAGFRVIGQGGMGVVYWALDTDLNRQVALKIVCSGPHCAGAASPVGLEAPPSGSVPSQAFDRLRARFLQEAWITAGLEHPGIVPVHEVGRMPGGVPYYTMRFVRGGRTLADAIEEAKARPAEGKLALLDAFLRVCDTVRYAHSHGVIHRDLKPANVALGEFGEVIVLDWGLAKVEGRPDVVEAAWQERLQEYREAADVKTGTRVLGTPGYMAPEAATGRVREIGARSDVYSLGAILFQILTGRLPYEFTTLGDLVRAMSDGPPRSASSVDGAIPESLSSICARALAPEPDTRTPSVDVLAAEIRQWIAQSVHDREVERLRREASVAMAATEGLEGDALLRQLDRARAAATSVLDRCAGDDAQARNQIAACERLREEGIRQRERTIRRRALRRVAIVGLAAAFVGAAAAAWVIDRKEQEAQRWLRASRALALTTKSMEAAPTDPTCALFLAREAVRSDPSCCAAADQLRRALAMAFEPVVLAGHAGEVTSAVFTPTDDWVVTGSSDRTVRVWSVSGRPRARIDNASFAGLSPDGSLILTRSGDGVVSLRDLDGRLRGEMRVRGGAAVLAAFSPGGDRVLTVSENGVVQLWDTTGTELPGPEAAVSPVRLAAFSPLGTWIITVSADGTADLWRPSGSGRGTLSLAGERIATTAFSPREDRLLTVSVDGAAHLWDVATRTVIGTLRVEGHPVVSATFSPRDDKVLVTTKDGAARLWDYPDGPIRALGDERDAAVSAIFAPDGKRIVIGLARGRVSFWNPDGTWIMTRADHAGEVTCAAFSGEANRVCTTCSVGVARVWYPDGRQVAVLRGHQDGILFVAFSHRGDLVATASRDRTACIWDLRRREPMSPPGRHDVSDAGVFAPQGERFLTTSGGAAHIRDFEGNEVATLSDPEGSIAGAAFSPLDGTIATWVTDGPTRLLGRDGTVRATLGRCRFRAFASRVGRLATTEGAAEACTLRVWDFAGGLVASFPVGRCAIVRLAPHGDLVLTLDPAGSVHMWDLTGRALATLGDSVQWVDFSPEGDRIVTASSDKTARVWDVAGNRILVLEGHQNNITCVAFAPDGSRIVTVSADKTMRVWDAATGRKLVTRRQESQLAFAAFSPQGDVIATGAKDGSVRHWTRDGEPLGELAEATPPAATGGGDPRIFFSPDGRRVLIATAGGDDGVRVVRVRLEDVLAFADGSFTRGLTADERALYAELLESAR